MSDEKSLLRRELRLRRREMPSEERAELSRRIAERLLSTDEYRRVDTVLCFVSTDIEVDTTLIIEAALDGGKRLAVPRCLPDRQMEFGLISSTAELVTGAYDIKEPPACCEVIDPADAVSAICIVPGLAFDKDGYRLGFGGGYYDRFLPHFRGKACGICYESFILPQLPKGRYDRPVDMLVTDEKTERSAL